VGARARGGARAERLPGRGIDDEKAAAAAAAPKQAVFQVVAEAAVTARGARKLGRKCRK
jgi:hypothetical protein